MTCKAKILIGLAAILTMSGGRPARAEEPSTGTGPRLLRKEVIVPASRDAVWRAWTTEAGPRFFGQAARIELKVGGAFEILLDLKAPPGSQGSEGCRVLGFVPGEMLAFDWNAPPSIPRLREAGVRTQVVVQLEGLGGGETLVRLTQHGFGEGEDWERYYAYFDRAWGKVLAQLKQSYVKPGSQPPVELEPSASNLLRQSAVIEGAVAEVWAALTTKQGMESWLAPHCEIDLKLGGLMRVQYSKDKGLDDPSTIENAIICLEPERMYALKVSRPPAGFRFQEAIKDMWTVIRLEPLGSKATRVTCTSMGFNDRPDSQEMRGHFEKGNAWTLRKLKQKFAPPAGD